MLRSERGHQAAEGVHRTGTRHGRAWKPLFRTDTPFSTGNNPGFLCGLFTKQRFPPYKTVDGSLHLHHCSLTTAWPIGEVGGIQSPPCLRLASTVAPNTALLASNDTFCSLVVQLGSLSTKHGSVLLYLRGWSVAER